MRIGRWAAGLSVGNDDLGTMSAWYVWSATGIYPNPPGTADMALGNPLFTEVTISLGGGTISISALQAAATGIPYGQSAKRNGATWNNAYLPPSFMTGGASTGATDQQWNVNADGTVVGVESGKCLDAVGHGSPNGTALDLWTCTGGANQKRSRN